MLNGTSVCRQLQLPTMPSVAHRLVELARDPETTLNQFVKTVRIDPALCVQLLRAVCSKTFGNHTNVNSIEKAISILGPTVSQSLALGFHVLDETYGDSNSKNEYVEFWRQSVATRTAAEIIAHRVSRSLMDDYGLTGLLLGIGRLARLSGCIIEENPVVAEFQSSSINLNLQMSAIVPPCASSNDAAIGARMLDDLGFPAVIVDAIRHHHDEAEQSLEYRDSFRFPFRTAMALASAVGLSASSREDDAARQRAIEFGKRLFDWNASEVESLVEEVIVSLEAEPGMFGFDLLPSACEMTQLANEQLMNVALRSHVAATQAVLRLQTVERERNNLEFQTRQLQRKVLHDPLTKTYNRQFFDEMLETETRRCLRCAEPLGVIFADVDHFKRINDTYGHPYGDDVLQKIAALFRSAIRNSDILARYGGEEFVILINQPTEKGIERLAERIRTCIEEAEFVHNGVRVPVTVSLGASIAVPGRNDTDLGRRLVASADECLYEAKRRGRNRTVTRSLVEESERLLLQMVQQHRFSRWLVSQSLLDIPSVSKALLECKNESLRLGDIAMELGYLDPGQVQHIVVNQEVTGERFGIAAVRLGWMNEEQLVHVLSLQQENPKQLAAAIIRLGLLCPDRVTAALEDYLAKKTPAPLQPLQTTCSA